MVVPKELQGLIKGFLGNKASSAAQVEMLKSVFIAVMGEEVEEPLDLVLKELLPELTKEISALPGFEETWLEVFDVDGIKKFVTDLKLSRLSLLHLYRVYAKASSSVNLLIGFSIHANLLSILLTLCFPQINLYSALGTKRIAQLVVFFGPSILKKILPLELFKVLSAFFNVISEIIGYIFKRVGLIILRAIVRHLFKSEDVDSIKRQLQAFQQHLTREGELSFEPCLKKKPSSVIEFKKQPSQHKEELVITGEKSQFGHIISSSHPKSVFHGQFNRLKSRRQLMYT